MPSTSHSAPHPPPPIPHNGNAWVTVIVIIVILTAGLVLGGVAPSTAVGTLSAAGLAAVEILRRLAAIPVKAIRRG
jgi:hypothetical protein